MDAKTLQALNESIAHWEQNLAAETPEQASVNWQNCSLCRSFIESGCDGCPVCERTGLEQCIDTPYGDARFALITWKQQPTDENRNDFHEAALAELQFLQSLLPVEQVSGIGEEGQEPQDAGEAGW